MLPKILCVAGARPNFMKIAPVMRALSAVKPKLDVMLVHTGQHYDVAMNQQFFDQLGIPEADINLEVGSSSHAQQTAQIMLKFEPVLEREKPAAILVVGDVNSTIACALVASKLGVPVIHVEAGLRSYDRHMPEEINRVLTDQLSDFLFTTERSALENLGTEGIAAARVHFVGNVMIDTLKHSLPKAISAASNVGEEIGNNYGLLTLHRPSNVDSLDILKPLIETLVTVSKKLPLVFPVHPRTGAKLSEFDLDSLLDQGNIKRIKPQGYFEMLGLMRDAKLVLTDSGGIQEETTTLGVPCVTLRENTERPITVEQGTNTIVGTDSDLIYKLVDDILANRSKAGRVPEYWDGRAAERMARIISDWCYGTNTTKAMAS